MPVKIRTKTVDKEAVQWTGKNLDEVYAFAGLSVQPIERRPGYDLKIQTPNGIAIVNRYEWIIRGLEGEFYPCSEDVFEKTYYKIPE